MVYIVRYWKQFLALVLALALIWLGWEWRDRSADVEAATAATQAQADKAALAEAALADVMAARAKEEAAIEAQVKAEQEADQRNDQIEADYQRRLAGVDAERDRLQDRWAGCETDLLASGAGAAAAVAEKDRLRRESAARIVRAAELAQSERDEVIDRYEAVRKAYAPK